MDYIYEYYAPMWTMYLKYFEIIMSYLASLPGYGRARSYTLFLKMI